MFNYRNEKQQKERDFFTRWFIIIGAVVGITLAWFL